MKSWIPTAVLAVVSYIAHIVGIITLTVAITIKNTYEYTLATSEDFNKIIKTLNSLGVKIDDFSGELQKLSTCTIIGIVACSVAVLTLIACVVLAFFTARANADIKKRKIKREIYSESKNAVNEEKRRRERAEVRRNDSFSTQSVYSQTPDRAFVPVNSKNEEYSADVPIFPNQREANRPHTYGKTGGTLFCTGGYYEGASFSIRSGEEVVIGSDPSICNIVIGDAYSGISRLHLTLRLRDDGMMYYVTDYSLNGTYAYGKRLTKGEQTTLALGTIITIGNGPESFRLE